MLKRVIFVSLCWLMLAPLTLTAGTIEPKAGEIADKVMQALGGAEAWQETRVLTWKFFGNRFHIWDKHSGDIRVEDTKGSVVIMNLNTKQGRAWENGAEITDATKLQEKLDGAYRAWVNDSYWLVMPYKLKDPGVNLSYEREDETQAGVASHVLKLTFDDGTGVTPQNKYEVFVGKDDYMVHEWAYFPQAGDEEPRLRTPWDGWQQHGAIMLPKDFGRFSHQDVAVMAEPPQGAFSDPTLMVPVKTD